MHSQSPTFRLSNTATMVAVLLALGLVTLGLAMLVALNDDREQALLYLGVGILLLGGIAYLAHRWLVFWIDFGEQIKIRYWNRVEIHPWDEVAKVEFRRSARGGGEIRVSFLTLESSIGSPTTRESAEALGQHLRGIGWGGLFHDRLAEGT